MIITIDGPAGAGKSSTAKALAARLGFRFLDTGAMYRAVALAGLRRSVDWNRPEELAALAREIHLRFDDHRLLMDGLDVTAAIRTNEVTAATRYAANNPQVREHLVKLQRAAAGNDNLITDGRDQGTVVFPHAECKIFLTASPRERAERRRKELAARGEECTIEQILEQQMARDASDEGREVGPLVPAADAAIVCTDGMTPEEVLEHLEYLVWKCGGVPNPDETGDEPQ